ncbi:hypothetical protein COX68_00370 [Candidatus Falkowbacteria bacterium CG_4_10_14_0_2_um_filter_41_15]|uniref:Uncharacterized protein n=1 Tax=Candidatus Falkowbacteria bacterium CG_4_10_14_0_2_um_filter_41_15 TaxID=1974554 RepID=A0A2M7W069_9BACT|nr:MAG: hypothetical protein COX68_00370 [Candidatus Falkowbacteria bacterium CG_4_10_14_0_2_um_filter_41_15]
MKNIKPKEQQVVRTLFNVEVKPSIYQFKIALRDVKPSIWRRIQVPEDYSFYDLHCVIHDVFGWFGYHLHEFETIDIKPANVKRIGIPDEEMGCFEVLPCWAEKIKEWFNLQKKAMNYIYDFGDNWVHRVELEKILPREKDVRYPICLAGKRACPPEDCGGPWGYGDMLAILKNPKHEEYNEILEWLGGGFDAEEFNINEVEFGDPKQRFIESGLAERFGATNGLEQIRARIGEIKERNIMGKIDWEIDYFKHSAMLRDDLGNIVQPLMCAIVHPESYYVIDSQIVSPLGNYLLEFLKRIVFSLENASMFPRKIKVKKPDLFFFLEKALSDSGIEIELVKKTPGVDSFKREARNFFNNPRPIK